MVRVGGEKRLRRTAQTGHEVAETTHGVYWLCTYHGTVAADRLRASRSLITQVTWSFLSLLTYLQLIFTANLTPVPSTKMDFKTVQVSVDTSLGMCLVN